MSEVVLGRVHAFRTY